ncbi:MAG: HAD-IIA family hydrolase [Actinomycetota bacterium]|nr:HAD-IIA family hydrolase [Actinomycetota bacterium]
MGWVLDLDGVLWLADQAIPGAAEAVASLRDAGHEVLFVTNNSSRRLGEQEAKLARFGVPAEGDVISSAMAAAELVEPGETALVCAGPGVTEALERRGARPVADGPADVVVVGYHTDFDYARMTAASVAVRDGARLVGTNDDPTYPTPDGPIPGGGAILASIATATGVAPEVAGKPNEPMARLVRRRLGPTGVVIGDRPDTDGAFARTLGYTWGLVLSGVTTAEDLPTDPEPDLVSADLAEAVRAMSA